ncbi:MAG: SseB family protein [Ruminococcus sp.]|jgi:hypothetical protein|nr:SseB family protein [Ruminococcus sp.]
MSKEKERDLAAMKKAAAERLRKPEQVYVLFSQCTRMPYVVCDGNTYDDEILLYFQEETAKSAVKKLLEEKEPVQALKIEKKDLLSFFVSLMPLGVNCILVNQEPLPDKTYNGKETEDEMSSEPALMEIPIQLDEIIRRKEPEDKGKVLIENPQFHLTALYFMQKVRKSRQAGLTDELKELHEEMMAHYQRGKYIIPVKENAGTLVMKQKDGQIFQPVFTDVQEYKKFLSMNREEHIKTAVLPAEKIPGILAPETAGVAVNPFGVNLQLQIKRGK